MRITRITLSILICFFLLGLTSPSVRFPKISFYYNSAKPRYPDLKDSIIDNPTETLQHVSQFMKNSGTTLSLQILSYCDSKEKNKIKLCNNRAEYVKNELHKLNLDTSKIKTILILDKENFSDLDELKKAQKNRDRQKTLHEREKNCLVMFRLK